MKKFKIWNSILFIIVSVFLLLNSCKKDDPSVVHDFGNFSDARDGHVYKTIEIGTQTWFAENLAYEGAGREITDITEWQNNAAFDGWCYYENDKTIYGNTYGILYQWEVAKVACPTGWHLPSYLEMKTLSDYLGGTGEAGGKLKETGTTHWESPNDKATNESGFTGLPGGIRRSGYSSFCCIGRRGDWWSSTDMDSTKLASAKALFYNRGLFGSLAGLNDMLNGLSVRCLKD